jgi:hypothetical protein
VASLSIRSGAGRNSQWGWQVVRRPVREQGGKLAELLARAPRTAARAHVKTRNRL